MHPIQQHTGHPLQSFGQGGDTLDGPSHGAVDDEQNLVHHLTLLELPLNLSQSTLIIRPGLQTKKTKGTNIKLLLNEMLYIC